MSTISFPQQQYVFQDIKVFVSGREIKIFGVKFNISEDDEFVYVNEKYPVAIQPGPVSPTGELTILQSELITWLNGLPSGTGITDDYYDIIILYRPKNLLPVVKRVLKYCKISSYEEGMNQGDKMMKVPLPFKFLGVENG